MLKLRYIIGLALAFGLGVGAATLAPSAGLFSESNSAASSSALVAVDPAADPGAAAWRGGHGLIAQQAYGRRCATPNGICDLDNPKPLGEPCECDNLGWGTTIE